MAQEYEVTWFQPTDFADNHNNYWCNVAFQGVSEPLKWVVKDPTKVKVGDKVFGEIKEQTSKAGSHIRGSTEQNVLTIHNSHYLQAVAINGTTHTSVLNGL